jgi:adenylate cyclase
VAARRAPSRRFRRRGSARAARSASSAAAPTWPSLGASLTTRLLVAAGALAAALALAFQAADVFSRAELETLHARFQIRGEEQVRDVVIVGIDDRTFEEMPRQDSRYPFSRCSFARALEQVDRGGPVAIVYDVQFTEPSDDPRCDNRLVRASARAGNVIFATTEVGVNGASNVFGGLQGQDAAKAAVGNGLLPEEEGALLRVPYEIDGLRTLAAAAYEQIRGAVAQVPDGGAWIDYAGGPGHVPTVSFSRAGEVPAATYRGRVVVMGATAPVLQDRHSTGWSDAEMAGPEIHAHAIRTLLRGTPLRESPGWLGLLLAAGVALVAPAAGLWLRATRAVAVAVAALAAYLVVVQLAFGGGRILPVAAPVVGWATGLAGSLLVFWTIEAVARARTRDTFGRFVGEDVVERVLARADGDRLPGERLPATVLFADLRGFTSFAEERDPQEVVDFLNRYLTEMSDVVLDHGGTLVSFLGDGIMAVFGAPVPQDDHADRALEAARAMLARRDAYEGFAIGIGLHSGEVMSATVGSPRRLEYTAVGDTTNTASRLQGMTGEAEVSLLLSEATRSALAGPPEDLVDLGERPVRGRRASIRVWRLASDPA